MRCVIFDFKSFFSKACVLVLLFLYTTRFELFGQTHDGPLSSVQKMGAYFSIVTHVSDVELKSGNADFLPLNSVGFPVGVNFWIRENFAFSIEFVPGVRFGFQNMEGTHSIATAGLLFHPGFTWTFADYYGFSARIAFESNGQIGFTPVIGRTIYYLKNSNISVSVPFPFRFGGNLPTILSVGVQLGWGF